MKPVGNGSRPRLMFHERREEEEGGEGKGKNTLATCETRVEHEGGSRQEAGKGEEKIGRKSVKTE